MMSRSSSGEAYWGVVRLPSLTSNSYRVAKFGPIYAASRDTKVKGLGRSEFIEKKERNSLVNLGSCVQRDQLASMKVLEFLNLSFSLCALPKEPTHSF